MHIIIPSTLSTMGMLEDGVNLNIQLAGGARHCIPWAILKAFSSEVSEVLIVNIIPVLSCSCN